MNNEQLLYENATLREVIQDLVAENNHLRQKLYNIELYINEYERGDNS